jgi:hypothetical protein
MGDPHVTDAMIDTGMAVFGRLMKGDTLIDDHSVSFRLIVARAVYVAMVAEARAARA